MDKKTLVIFFSDNGGTRQADNGMLSGFKGHLWEGGIRVPCIIRWPGMIEENTLSGQVGIGFDLTRSILKISGYPRDSVPVDGYDIIGHIVQQRENFDRTLFWRAKRGNSVKKAVRDGDDKYMIEIINDSIRLEKLFNLKEDVSETRNLLDALPGKADKLKTLLKEWEQEVNINLRLDVQGKEHKKFIYKQDTRQLHQMFSEAHLRKAKRAREEMDSVIYNGPYKANYESLSLHHTPDWFRDAKFGIAVNYGIYSVAGVGEQGYGGNYYTDTYTNTMYGTLRSYHIENWGEDFERDDFIPLFNAKYLNAEEYVNLFKKTGAKYVAVFLNHRSTGMLLWDSDYTFRDSKDMPPHRDLAEEFRNACRRNKIPFCAYFNLEDTDYPIADPGTSELFVREWTQIGSMQRADKNSYEQLHPYNPEKEERRLQGKIPVHDYVDDYLLPISKELIDTYEPDYIWFDGGWKRPAWYYKSHKMAAYYYNKYEGNREVLVNCRLGADLYGKLGDVVISEGGSSDEAIQTDYWEEITPMGRNFAFDRWENDDNVPSSTDLIHMLIRIVAGGGNLLLIVAPDGQGQIPWYQLKRLHEIGRWLEINGEAIYKSVGHPLYCEEDKFGYRTYYTRSKNHRYTYAITSKLGRNRKILYKAKAKEGTDVKLLGYENNLEWFNSDWGLNILLSEDVLDHLPCSHAWVFRFEEKSPQKGLQLQTD